MSILNFNNKKEVKEYEEFLNSYKNYNFMQDLKWKDVKRNWNYEVVYLKENNKIYAGMLILIKKIPHTNISLMYSPRGPVCDIYNIEVVNKLILEAKPLAKKYNAYSLTFDPGVVYSKELDTLYKNNKYKTTGPNPNPDSLIQPRYEAKIYLKDNNIEDLMKSFRGKTRYNIRLAEKNNVKVTYSHKESDLKEFYKLYKITSERDKIGLRTYEYLENMLKVYNEDELRIYLTKHEDDYLSGAIAIRKGNEVYYAYGASSNNKRNLMPNYVMQKEMIKWAIETKCRTYSFGGVINNNPNDGLYKFKIGFCRDYGYEECIGEISKVYKPIIFFTVKNLLIIKKKISRIIKK